MKELMSAYAAAGKISVDQSASTEVLSTTYKNMRGKTYKSYREIEDGFKTYLSQAKGSISTTTGGGGGGSSSGGSFKITEPVSKQTDGENNKGETVRQESGVISAPMYFKDIEDSKWALSAINYLYENKVISGNGDGTFSPSRYVSRPEFAKMLVSLRKYEISANQSPFSDVDKGAWYAPYVTTAYEKNLITGYEDGSFGISAGITRQEAACVIYRLIREEGDIDRLKDHTFTFADDANIGEWAKEAVYTLYANGVISGRSAEIYSPSETLTRAEAAVLLYNARTFFTE